MMTELTAADTDGMLSARHCAWSPQSPKTLAGTRSNNSEPHFTDQERSSERSGTWPKLTQVGTGEPWTWTSQSDPKSTQPLAAPGIAVTLRNKPLAGTGVLRLKGLRGHLKCGS